MNQDQQKQAAAQAALEHIDYDMIVGVGTGSTTNFFIDLLADKKSVIEGAVASSMATEERLKAHGIRVLDLNQVNGVPVYVDGADEADPNLNLIKGGGGALTREKIIAATAEQFICIVDGSKLKPLLGRFPLPVEVIPMAQSHVGRSLAKLGGNPRLRDGFVTDNGNIIIDVDGFDYTDPRALEDKINRIAGVVTVGLFAHRPADTLLVATDNGVVVHRRR